MPPAAGGDYRPKTFSPLIQRSSGSACRKKSSRARVWSRVPDWQPRPGRRPVVPGPGLAPIHGAGGRRPRRLSRRPAASFRTVRHPGNAWPGRPGGAPGKPSTGALEAGGRELPAVSGQLPLVLTGPGGQRHFPGPPTTAPGPPAKMAGHKVADNQASAGSIPPDYNNNGHIPGRRRWAWVTRPPSSNRLSAWSAQTRRSKPTSRARAAVRSRWMSSMTVFFCCWAMDSKRGAAGRGVPGPAARCLGRRFFLAPDFFIYAWPPAGRSGRFGPAAPGSLQIERDYYWEEK